MAHIMRGIMQRGGLNVPGQRDQGKAQNGGKDRGNKAAGGLRLGSHCSHGLLLAVTPDDLFQVSHAWQVSWLAGRCLCPPSPSEDEWHSWAQAHRLQSRGRLPFQAVRPLRNSLFGSTPKGALAGTPSKPNVALRPSQGKAHSRQLMRRMRLPATESRADRKCRPRFAGSGGGPPVKCPAKPGFVSFFRPGARRYLRKTRQKLSGHA